MPNRKISLPYNFTPLEHQKFLEAWILGLREWLLFGIDEQEKIRFVLLNIPKKMFLKKAAYFYLAPTYKQGKKIILIT